MSELRLETYTMPAAGFGEENPLPPLNKCLPYALQDDYDRKRTPRSFKTVVLENEILKAVFLTELGGRLWSLYHKKEQRELLYVNPVLQLGNLAIRNAWFSGGVEWNMGTKGHSVFTCSPVFAGILKTDDGTPVLRMYEWDRIHMVPYQIDAFLPDNSDFLFIRVKIMNPHEHDIPMYWWSNIAVPEIPGGRVLVPAESAYRHAYKGKMVIVPVPVFDGVDLSYPENFNRSADSFYIIDQQRPPWITALDKEGTGLIQASTKKLRGRKMFVWGMGNGGRNWQEFLSVPGSAYIELQAGLAQTQSEYLQMPAGAEWSWLEAYGMIRSCPEAVHGENWKSALQSVDAALAKSLPPNEIEAKFEETAKMSLQRPDEIIQRGSGWGALERRRREKSGEKPFCSDSLIFDDESLTDEQSSWLGLLEDGSMPCLPPMENPGGWMIQSQWQDLLEKAVKNGDGDHWLSWLHLGIMYYSRHDFAKAGQAWEKSLERVVSPWAYRNLAVLQQQDSHAEVATGFLMKAWKMISGIDNKSLTKNIALEYCKSLIEAERPGDMLDFMRGLSPDIRNIGRFKLMEARAALQKGDLRLVEKILQSRNSFVDIREGEVTLSDLWFEMHEKRIAKMENIPIDDELHKKVRRDFPPPIWLDFRQAV